MQALVQLQIDHLLRQLLVIHMLREQFTPRFQRLLRLARAQQPAPAQLTDVTRRLSARFRLRGLRQRCQRRREVQHPRLQPRPGQPRRRIRRVLAQGRLIRLQRLRFLTLLLMEQRQNQRIRRAAGLLRQKRPQLLRRARLQPRRVKPVIHQPRLRPAQQHLMILLRLLRHLLTRQGR